MRLHVKIGTLPAQHVSAPKLRRAPEVGKLFQVREERQKPLVTVLVRENTDLGDGDILYFLERM